MSLQDQQAFERFKAGNESWLYRLSYKTAGEYRYNDVVNEAWVTAADIQAQGKAVDFDCPSFQDLLRSYLWQRLAKFQEKNMRGSLRLDHHPGGDGDDQPHPLSRLLAADEEAEPDTSVFLAEVEKIEQAAWDSESSLAKAYIQLLEHFRYQIAAMADYLLISVSTARKRCNDAIEEVKWQRSFHWENADQLPFPRPWRRHRCCDPPPNSYRLTS